MAVFISGTGTDVGKTILSALIMARYGSELGLRYHKPVQTGGDSDRMQVALLSGLTDAFFIAEKYSYPLAASPHYAAEQHGNAINPDELLTSLRGRAHESVIIELAGGVLVPLTRNFTNLDLMRQVGLKTILVAATGLGTINHTLLTLSALRAAGVECAGVFFVGEENPLYTDNMRTIIQMGKVGFLGEFFLSDKNLTPAEFRVRAKQFDADHKVRALLS